MQPGHLHIGAYGEAGAEGVYAIDIGGPRLSLIGVYTQAPDASWIVGPSPAGVIYAVEERSEGAIGVHRLEGDQWRKVGQFASQGAEPCYLSLDPRQGRLAVANYGSGSIALFQLGQDGLPLAPAQVRTNQGSGPVADRQEGPHAHCVVFSPDGGNLYHVDLGTDQILRHALGDDGFEGAPVVAFQAPPGAGPRHLLFHPSRPLALLVSELASTLTILDIEDDRLVARQTCSTLPGGYDGESLGGHLAINRAGDRIYISNRGHDSLAVFALDDTGGCTSLQHIGSQGASPRFFQLLEAQERLALVNEEGGNLVLFRLLPDGRLEPTDQAIDLPGAAFVFPDPKALKQAQAT